MTMGLGFIGFGLYNFGSHDVNWVFTALGMAFFIFGLSQFFTAKKFRKQFRDRKG